MSDRNEFLRILQAIASFSDQDASRVEKLSRQKNVPLADAAKELELADEEQITKTHCKLLRLPYVNLSKAKVPARVTALIDADTAGTYRVLPVKEEPTGLVLAVDHPDRIMMLDDLRFRLGVEFRCALTTPTMLALALQEYYGLDAGALAKVDKKKSKDGDDEDDEDEDAPVIRLVNQVLEDALKQRASDVHVEPLAEKLRIRLRIDGLCREQPNPPLHLSAAVLSRIKLLAGMDIAEKRKPQDGRINIKLLGRHIDLRVSSLPAYHGESIVMRILDREQGLMSLPKLGFDMEDYQRFQKVIKRPNGLFLVTGPTGSGKTTSLYAALRELNRSDVKIITAEDPVEYNLSGINQCQVRHNIGLDFKRILRAMLRQAPNIILVGEIRDKETAEIAIQASLTGHLVFSTLHTNDAPSALTRLIDMGVKPFLVSTAVMAIMAQRLIRRLCKQCREPFEPTLPELHQLKLTPADLEGRTVYRPIGCAECSQTGYRGRVGVFELFVMDSSLRDLCFNGGSSMKLREQAKVSGGLVSLMEDGVRKFLAGETTIPEVLTVAVAGEIAAA
jgi:type IV pilus assembly protein PilB